MLLCAVKGLSHWNNFFIIFFFEGPTVSNYIYTLNCMYFCCWLISTYLRSFNYNLNDNLSLNYDLNDESFQFMSPNYNLNDKSWNLFTQISFIKTVMCVYDPPKKTMQNSLVPFKSVVMILHKFLQYYIGQIHFKSKT